ncbi:MAG: DAK2 domain-containing protein, partial [Spirochaetota bacterium]|nr:DAK2 domain-containing protein [Spirochaetota bacterium]
FDLSKLSECFSQGYLEAINSLSNPQEGTILTVMRACHEFYHSQSETYANSNDFTVTSLAKLYETSCQTLIDSRDKLELLKEAGVIDSGAYAFLFFIESLYFILSDENDLQKRETIFNCQRKLKPYTSQDAKRFQDYRNKLSNQLINSDKPDLWDQDSFRYCTEFIVSSKSEYSELQVVLGKMGDSLLIAKAENCYKVHIHTNIPDSVLQIVQKEGRVSHVKIDDMSQQHQHFLMSPEKPRNFDELDLEKVSLVSLALSQGFADVMTSLGVHHTIIPEDYNKPGLTDILSAFSGTKHTNIIALPNNTDLIPLFQAMADLSSKNVKVISSKSIPQGISAILNFRPDENLNENIRRMSTAFSKIKSFSITHAQNLVNKDNSTINHYLGLDEDGVILTNPCHKKLLRESIDRLLEDTASLITIYYGTTHSDIDIQSLRQSLEKEYNLMEIEFIASQHPDLLYVLSVE